MNITLSRKEAKEYVEALRALADEVEDVDDDQSMERGERLRGQADAVEMFIHEMDYD